MDDQIGVAVFVFVNFDEMVSSAEGTNGLKGFVFADTSSGFTEAF